MNALQEKSSGINAGWMIPTKHRAYFKNIHGTQ
jgi:hypothetical protein